MVTSVWDSLVICGQFWGKCKKNKIKFLGCMFGMFNPSQLCFVGCFYFNSVNRVSPKDKRFFSNLEIQASRESYFLVMLKFHNCLENKGIALSQGVSCAPNYRGFDLESSPVWGSLHHHRSLYWLQPPQMVPKKLYNYLDLSAQKSNLLGLVTKLTCGVGKLCYKRF